MYSSHTAAHKIVLVEQLWIAGLKMAGLGLGVHVSFTSEQQKAPMSSELSRRWT